MPHTRRDFLKRSCAGLGAAALSSCIDRFGLISALAQSADYRALVCIFLYGGNDGNNTIVPNGSDGYAAYAAARPELAIEQRTLLPIRPVSTDAQFGLHPSLAPLLQSWNDNRLAVICNAGTLMEPTTKSQYLGGSVRLPEQLFSHEDQQNQWQTVICDRRGETGWGGRLADRVRGLNVPSTFPMMISVSGDELFVSSAESEALPLIVDPGEGFVLDGYDDPSPETRARYNAVRRTLIVDQNHTLVAAASKIGRQALDSEQLLNEALNRIPPLTTRFPETGLGTQLKQIARIIAARNFLGLKRQIFFCAIGGFDTHSNQLPRHADQLTELAGGMGAFYNATIELGVSSQVTTFTHSEFGRTLKPNSRGTDHGWGSHQFVVGGSVRGGDFYGTFPTLALTGPDDTDTEGRWIPTTAVDQYAATLASWFGVASGDIRLVVPNIGRFSPGNLGFMR